MGLPDELSGGRGGRVAPGFGPTGGPLRAGAGRDGTTVPDATAAAAAAASRSIEGVAERSGAGGGASGGVTRVEAAAMRCEEMTLVATGGLAAAGAGTCSAAGAGGSTRAGGASSWWSGDTGRRSPSASALRRTRSAWASSIDEEWLFTPMPSEMERSRASLFVRPSSLASS